MNFKRQNRESVEVNLTPLIDVVFLLLIFFMVSTTFTKENHLKKQKKTQIYINLKNSYPKDLIKILIKTLKKSGILTVAFFSDKRVINIKGLNNFNKLASLLPNKEFLIVGESGINISDYINLEPNVKVIGVQNKFQIKSLYQKSKFYFQGSRLEGLPNSLCEAMLCGCVPIGSQVFGIPDAIGSTGILFDLETDLEQVADFINSNIGTNEFKNARKRIKKKFNLASRIEKIKENI